MKAEVGCPPPAASGTSTAPSGDMVHLPGGRFRMGSEDHYPEEAPVRTVEVDGFWIDRHPVTNEDFAAFVAATGWVTLAETPPDPAAYPGIRPDMLQAGSLCFRQPPHRVPLHDFTQWWEFRFGATWRTPYGPGSTIEGLGQHPVVHVTAADAEAYAAWAGKALPTEAEWEYAARGGHDGLAFAWGADAGGDVLAPGGAMMANYWQGEFPWRNEELDGFPRTSPVGHFPPNGHGLHDMIGNVWEWTADWYAAKWEKTAGCCVPVNPRGGPEAGSIDPCQPDIPIPRRVLKGGSHLCAANYCERYRPAARYPQPIDTSTSHVGFRCIVRGERQARP